MCEKSKSCVAKPCGVSETLGVSRDSGSWETMFALRLPPETLWEFPFTPVEIILSCLDSKPDLFGMLWQIQGKITTVLWRWHLSKLVWAFVAMRQLWCFDFWRQMTQKPWKYFSGIVSDTFLSVPESVVASSSEGWGRFLGWDLFAFFESLETCPFVIFSSLIPANIGSRFRIASYEIIIYNDASLETHHWNSRISPVKSRHHQSQWNFVFIALLGC